MLRHLLTQLGSGLIHFDKGENQTQGKPARVPGSNTSHGGCKCIVGWFQIDIKASLDIVGVRINPFNRGEY